MFWPMVGVNWGSFLIFTVAVFCVRVEYTAGATSVVAKTL
jgi:hypothetical protein